MMKTTRPFLPLLLAAAVAALALTGCGASNPNVSAAEDAFEQQNYEEALSSIETALEEDSANAEAYQLKAQILRQMADSTMPPDEYESLYERAREAEEMAIKFDPGMRSNVQGQRQLAYVQQFQRGGSAFNRGRQQGDTTQFRKAAAFFGAAGAIYPDSASAHLNEAYSRVQMGQQEEAIPVFERYMEVADTATSNAYNILARLYLTNGRTQQSIPLLEEATTVYPDDEELKSLLLTAYNQSGNMEKAMAAYREEVEENPDNPTYRYNYGSILLNADRYDEAIEQLEAAVRLDSTDAQAQYNLGAAYTNKAAALNDSIAVIQDSVRSQDRGPTDEEGQRLRELAQQRQNAFKQAVPHLEAARRMSGAGGEYYQDACRALFQAYVQLEQTEKAATVEQCAGFEEGRAEEAAGGQGG